MVDYTNVPPRYGWPMIGWNPPARRMASMVVFGVAALLFLVGVVMFFLNLAAAALVLWICFGVLAAALVFQLAVLFSGEAAEGNGPPWLAGMFGAKSAGRGQADDRAGGPRYPDVDLKCPECENVFSVGDSGERPLHTTCPHCGAEGLVDLPPPEETSEDEHHHDHDHAHHGHGHDDHDHTMAGGTAALDADDLGLDDEPSGPATENEVITLRCPACSTQFSVEDDGTRPLRAVCPGCGRGGRLR